MREFASLKLASSMGKNCSAVPLHNLQTLIADTSIYGSCHRYVFIDVESQAQSLIFSFLTLKESLTLLGVASTCRSIPTEEVANAVFRYSSLLYGDEMFAVKDSIL